MLSQIIGSVGVWSANAGHILEPKNPFLRSVGAGSATPAAGGIERTVEIRTQYSSGERLCDDPIVHVFDDVMTPEECDHIIGIGRPLLQPGLVSGAKGGLRSKGRSNALAWVKHWTDEVTLRVANRVAEIVGLPRNNAESFQVINYGPGQEYRPHYDAFNIETPRGVRCMARGGQRLVTTLLYFNAVEEGGATSFPHLDELAVQPKAGRMLLFHNCPVGTTDVHPKSLHHGEPVVRGEKWAANLWFRAENMQRPPPGID